MNTQKIEDQIISALKAIPSQIPTGVPCPDTKAIKLAIGTLGTQLGFAVRGFPEYFGDKEWLYDLCWYSGAPDKNKKLLDVPLVLESEWNQYGIIYDFEKLLIAKSKFKVMVFQANGQTAIDFFKELEQGIRTYQGGTPGEIYLLACFNGVNRGFEIKRIEGV
ncbi:MAG: hypothetical protein ACLP2Y_17200 [Limisphaerales bacterium]